MALLGHCLWFWWLCDNIINETNKFIKWIILGPKDEYKALAKQESKKELKRNAELVEVSHEIVAPVKLMHKISA